LYQSAEKLKYLITDGYFSISLSERLPAAVAAVVTETTEKKQQINCIHVMHDTVKARKLAYYGHTTNKQGSCLEKEIMQGRMPDARRRERPRTAWMNNIKTWTGLPVEESVRMTEDRIKLREYVHGVANTRIEDGSRTEQNRCTYCLCVCVSVGHDRELHENDLTDQVAVCAVDSTRASVCRSRTFMYFEVSS